MTITRPGSYPARGSSFMYMGDRWSFITVTNSRGATVVNAIVDMYSQYTTPARKCITPMLPRDRYTLRMTALGENWYWVNKRKERSGSKGYMVSFDKLTVQP